MVFICIDALIYQKHLMGWDVINQQQHSISVQGISNSVTEHGMRQDQGAKRGEDARLVSTFGVLVSTTTFESS